MLFQHWHKPLFYVNHAAAERSAIVRARAERVVARFWAAYRRGPH